MYCTHITRDDVKKKSGGKKEKGHGPRKSVRVCAFHSQPTPANANVLDSLIERQEEGKERNKKWEGIEERQALGMG